VQKTHNDKYQMKMSCTEAFLAAAVRGGHICIWGFEARIPDDIVCDEWVV